MIQIKNRFTGEVLFEAPTATLIGCAQIASENGVDLRCADIIDAGQDVRGYTFVGVLENGRLMIAGGCRRFTLDEARKHWSAAHADRPALRAQCIAKVDMIEAEAKARGWLSNTEGNPMTDYTDRETVIRDAKERRLRVQRIDCLTGLLMFGSMLASGCAILAAIAALVLWMAAPDHTGTAVSVALWMATMMILLIALAVITGTVGRVVARKGGLW